MTHARVVLALAGLSILVGCGEKPEGNNRQEVAYSDYPVVSFYRLLANTREYDGTNIAIHGVLSVDEKEHAVRLFVSKDAANHLVKIDSLSVELTSQQWQTIEHLSGRYTMVSGKFRAAQSINGLGVIREVERISGVEVRVPTLKSASESYQENKDYYSLRFIYSQIEPGASRAHVEALLGLGHEGHVNGVVCYDSAEPSPFTTETSLPKLGLLIDYRDSETGSHDRVARVELSLYERCLRDGPSQ